MERREHRAVVCSCREMDSSSSSSYGKQGSLSSILRKFPLGAGVSLGFPNNRPMWGRNPLVIQLPCLLIPLPCHSSAPSSYPRSQFPPSLCSVRRPSPGLPSPPSWNPKIPSFFFLLSVLKSSALYFVISLDHDTYSLETQGQCGHHSAKP